jgi:hypothetical protein
LLQNLRDLISLYSVQQIFSKSVYRVKSYELKKCTTVIEINWDKIRPSKVKGG